MAKILILANSDVGLYKFRKELLQELIKNNEVYISLPNGEYISNLEEIGCKFIDTPISRRGTNPITDFKLLIKYISIIKRVKPDVVLTYTIKPNIYGGLASKILNSSYLANITGLGSAFEKKGFMQELTFFLYRLTLKKANCVFFQNQENQRFLTSKGIAINNNKLIPGSGVDTDHYQLLDYPNEDTINFLFISRIMKEKGIEQYLEAAEHVRDRYPNTRFHVLGFCEEDYEEKLEQMQNRGIITYHGMQSDVREFHKISHCTVHPSFHEGMSNVVLESASCGRPAIVSNISGCKEIVDDGVNGYLVEQKNSQDLIDKIECFIKQDYELKKQMGLAGRKKVEKEFDRKIVINAYMDEINSLIKYKLTQNLLK